MIFARDRCSNRSNRRWFQISKYDNTRISFVEIIEASRVPLTSGFYILTSLFLYSIIFLQGIWNSFIWLERNDSKLNRYMFLICTCLLCPIFFKPSRVYKIFKMIASFTCVIYNILPYVHCTLIGYFVQNEAKWYATKITCSLRFISFGKYRDSLVLRYKINIARNSYSRVTSFS